MKIMTKFGLFLMLGLLPSLYAQDNFETWVQNEYQTSKQFLLENISRPDTIPGTVVASPSRFSPDYYYHWVRDASLVMLSVSRLYQNATDASEQEQYLKILKDFVAVTKIHQSQWTPAGLGEVKFLVDGRPFTGPWGRPQNDGPAIRAYALTTLAEILIAKGEMDFVKKELYDNKLPSQSLIKKDLEYVSHQWRFPDYDLWEEVKGTHFFTRLMQRKALLVGAKLAARLNDLGASDWYLKQAKEIEQSLDSHWNNQRGHIFSTINRVEGIDYKGYLDSSVILGVINADQLEENTFNILDDRYMASISKMNSVFSYQYKINQDGADLGVAIGRYPEDRYNGLSTDSLGNPWFITTLGFAQYHYELSQALYKKGVLLITKRNYQFFSGILEEQNKEMMPQIFVGKTLKKNEKDFHSLLRALFEQGDRYLKRVKAHVGPDGSMSEQINRDQGNMQGAEHLTWSYSAYLEAYWERNTSKQIFKTLK